MTTNPISIDACALDDDETRDVRVFVSDYYDEPAELEMKISFEGIDFGFYFDGEEVGRGALTHEALFRLLVEKDPEILKML
jgi:hypothetical protein